MDSNPAPGVAAPRPAALGQSATPDLRAEVVGTLVIFVLTVFVTAGVAVFAHVLVRAVG